VVNRFAVRIWSFTPRSFALATDISHMSPIGPRHSFPSVRSGGRTLPPSSPFSVNCEPRTVNCERRTVNCEPRTL
jgi:hypothetical protein